MEVCQVLVVSEDLDGEWGSMEIMPLEFQGMDDSEELPVVDVVVSFYRDERLGEIGAGMPITIRIGLKENSAQGIF